MRQAFSMESTIELPGSTPATSESFCVIAKAAPTRATDLIEGESGRCIAPDYEIVATALTLIRDRQGDVSAAEIAELFSVSVRRSRFHLEKATGKNLRTICLEARLAPARPRVRDTNQPIDAIARAFGYRARGKFEVSYEQVYGVTPAADRAQARRRAAATPSRRPSSHQLSLRQFQEQPLRE